MKAVVLVGGEGTRMRPLTQTIPKPLLPFMNRPFLDHVLEHLAGHGIDEVICSSPYLERVFREFLGSRAGRAPDVRWITEEHPLGTAGAIAGASEHLDETFLVLNGDLLTDIDLGELVVAHRARGAVGTIALTAVEDARPFGLVEFDAEGRVLAFREKPSEPGSGMVNAGVYVLEPEALDDVPRGVMVSIERETYPGLIERGAALHSVAADGYWRDVGTPEAYLAGHLDALHGRLRTYPDVARPLLGSGVSVAGTASIAPDVVLGDRTRVGEGARVDRSVLHADVEVGADSVVVDSVLGPRAIVEPGAELHAAVLGEGAVVAAGERAVGSRVGPGERLSQA